MEEDDKAKHLAELLDDPESLERERAKQQTDYMRNYRKNHPEVVEANRATIRAQARALRRLAADHADEYHVYYTEERAKEGLPPPRRRKFTNRQR